MPPQVSKDKQQYYNNDFIIGQYLKRIKILDVLWIKNIKYGHNRKE
jgi:hypothetical protein